MKLCSGVIAGKQITFRLMISIALRVVVVHRCFWSHWIIGDDEKKKKIDISSKKKQTLDRDIYYNGVFDSCLTA
jgi:hypothetical protein